MKKIKCIRRICGILAALFLSVSLTSQLSAASEDTEGLVKAGDVISAFSVPAPKGKAHRKYLGLGKEDQFNPSKLKAKVIIIEVLNLY